MRYTPTPGQFPVTFWKGLWHNNIDDIENLRELAKTRGIVAVDLDPWKPDGLTTHEGITEFGIAFLPPVNASLPPPSAPSSPASLDTLVENFSIQSYSIKVADRKRSEKRREAYRYGESQVVTADQVENTALAIINSFTTNKHDSHPVLVGFSLGYELRILTKFYPRLLAECFSAWADIQEITNDVSTVVNKLPVPVQKPNKAAYVPGMCDTLWALGYLRDNIAITGLKNEHSAGNDAVRVLAVLLGLLALPQTSTGPLLKINQYGRKLYQKIDRGHGLVSRKYWKSIPGPPELFLYMAKVRAQPTGAPVPKDFGVPSFYDYFAEFEPVSAGVSKEAGDLCFYLCLPTAEALERFLVHVDGHAPSNKLDGIVWLATPEKVGSEKTCCEGNSQGKLRLRGWKEDKPKKTWMTFWTIQNQQPSQRQMN
ncbi:unnamed protein product [Clonostachys rosea]|uniref:Gfd2/YDR514C-like C-terminal domain-containing protein n=1 Tax=Bionectria ochroleuca TaxID=29856 RepID=A0ABY6UB59_BIOOC|nr:unnamed protein product [Clonostachys rosea]